MVLVLSTCMVDWASYGGPMPCASDVYFNLRSLNNFLVLFS